MNSSPSSSSPGRLPLYGGIAALAVVLLLLSLSTCGDSPSTDSVSNQATDTNYSASSPEQCQRTLDNLLDGLAPGRFGITSDRRILVDTLTNWFGQCADPEAFVVSENDLALRERYLPSDVLELTTRERFSERDAEYFRNVMLARDMMEAALGDEQSDLQRAVSLFYRVVSTVDLRMPQTDEPRFGPYEMALFGSGTAADRAWLFALLLRQLRLDAVVLRPRSDDVDQTKAFLLGVIIPEEGVYLFDTQLGLPIASPTDESRTPLPREPVEFATALNDDSVFRQFDERGIRYPLTAEILADVEVLAIGESSTWSPRFGTVQVALPIALELFDGLAESSVREFGLIERLVRAGRNGRWEEDDVGVWDYPEQVYRETAAMSPAQSQRLQFLYSVMEGPLMVRVEQQNGNPVPRFETPQRNLHQARVDHLQGEYSSAKEVYLRTRLAVRSLGNQEIPPNASGADWSAYWVALAQYQQGDYVAAAESIERYLNKTQDWVLAGRTLLAKCLAAQERFDEAVEVLSKQAFRTPQRTGNQWLIARWQRLAKNDPPESASPAESETPTEPSAAPEPSEPAEPSAAEPGEASSSAGAPSPATPQDAPVSEQEDAASVEGK